MVIELGGPHFVTSRIQSDEQNVLVNILFNVTNQMCCTESPFAHIPEHRKTGDYLVEVSWLKWPLYQNCNVKIELSGVL
jgi:hypothetical protein